MSRIGKNPINVPKEVKVTIGKGTINLEGPKGKLDLPVPQGITVDFKESKLVVNRLADAKQDRANHGTIRAHLVNMVEGVTKGHKKELEIQGLGFRAALQGKKIVFSLGFSHPVDFDVPDDVKIAVDNQTMIRIEGVNNMRVGMVASQIKSLKPVEPYKGKGIRYVGEFVRRKQGKSVTK